jgi:hypothetical protein
MLTIFCTECSSSTRRHNAGDVFVAVAAGWLWLFWDSHRSVASFYAVGATGLCHASGIGAWAVIAASGDLA